MNVQDMFFFAIFAALGIFRVSLLPFVLALGLSLLFVVVEVSQPKRFMGIPLEKSWAEMLVPTLIMGFIYIVIYGIAYLAAESVSSRKDN
jgi:hypothetical protein